MLLGDEHIFYRGVYSCIGVCMVDWSEYYSGQWVDSLTRLVMLRHHDGKIGGSIPGLGSFNTVLSVKHTNAITPRLKSRATSRGTSGTSRRLFKHTIWSLGQHTSATTCAIGNAIIFKTVGLSYRRSRRLSRLIYCIGRRVGWFVALVCIQSRDCRVCRCVPRRVHNLARAGVFCFYIYIYTIR